MPNPKRWKFGQIEVVTSNFVIKASELSVLKRIETLHQFTYLLESWLGEPKSRATWRDIEREVTSGVTQMGRLGGREFDRSFIAALQSAFQAGKFHVLHRQGRAKPGPLVANGKSWRFLQGEILQSDAAFRIGKLSDLFLINDAAVVSKALRLWLKDSDDRRRILEIYEFAGSDSDESNNQSDNLSPDSLGKDKKIADKLLEAWEDGSLLFLQHRIEGGNGDDAEVAESADAPLAGTAKQAPSPVKTWIEIVLTDDKGKPVPGEKYWLRITDGSTREGTLDSQGSVRVNGIDPGSCEVCFPNLDGREWYAA